MHPPAGEAGQARFVPRNFALALLAVSLAAAVLAWAGEPSQSLEWTAYLAGMALTALVTGTAIWAQHAFAGGRPWFALVEWVALAAVGCGIAAAHYSGGVPPRSLWFFLLLGPGAAAYAALGARRNGGRSGFNAAHTALWMNLLWLLAVLAYCHEDINALPDGQWLWLVSGAAG